MKLSKLNLREFRERQKMSVEDVSAKCTLSVFTISKMELADVGELYLSDLIRYFTALGGRLEIRLIPIKQKKETKRKT